jgi:hypothetical protein
MEGILSNYLEEVKIGGRQVYKNLAMFPLLSNRAIDLYYLTMDEALGEGLVEITEKTEGGSVPELQVVNKSPKMVLILDGEELAGAKQNRIVNTTILVAGLAILIIPVSCVEQGRWSYDSPRFSSQERILPNRLRAGKAEQVQASLRTSQKFRSDQGAIWDAIEAKADRLDARSPSMAMSVMYQRESANLEDYSRHFRPIEGQVGAVFLINGQVAGLDSFGKPDTFLKVFKKLIQSYALDAVDFQDPDKKVKVSKTGVSDLIQSARSASLESRPSVGLGTDFRLESRKAIGFALALDDRVVHLSIFARSREDRERARFSRMGSFSSRRRNR